MNIFRIGNICSHIFRSSFINKINNYQNQPEKHAILLCLKLDKPVTETNNGNTYLTYQIILFQTYLVF